MPRASQPVRNIGNLTAVMSSRRSLQTLLCAFALAAGLIGAPQVVKADGVKDAQQQLQQVQNELESLQNQMGQLDEDYGAAQDRKDQVDADIVVAQAKVDEMSAQLGDVQQVMQDIAVTKFTTGGSAALSPLFSDAATFSAAEQKAAFGRVALDTGESTADDLQSMVDDLAKEKANLDRKQAEAASLVATLEQKQTDFAALEQTYTTKLAKAQADFGAAKLEAEVARRARAEADAAAAAAAKQKATTTTSGSGNSSAPAPAPSPGRGGGGSGSTGSSGSSGGSGNSGGTGGSSGGTVPPVSGRAGVAVAAAYSVLGTPYHFAGETPFVAFDCSGLTKWAWGRAGVSLPHQSGAQYASTPHVPKDQVQPGDLIFYKSPIGHVAIYIGGGQMIHAPATGDVVKISVVNWAKVVGVGRPG